ncbi:MAG: hypothetical protein S4CHLAM37_12920 [Chlamydiia bacterium]|nr:hypothetical protein [Chlamydiia bacterium]
MASSLQTESKLHKYTTAFTTFHEKLGERRDTFADIGEAREANVTCNALSVSSHTRYGDATIEALRVKHGETGTINEAEALLATLGEELGAISKTIADFERTVATKQDSPAALQDEDEDLAKVPASTYCSKQLIELRKMATSYEALMGRLEVRIKDCKASLAPSTRATVLSCTWRAFGVLTGGHPIVYEAPEGASETHDFATTFNRVVETAGKLSTCRIAQFDLNRAYDRIKVYALLRERGIEVINGDHVDQLVAKEHDILQSGERAKVEIEAFATEVGSTITKFTSLTKPAEGSAADLLEQYEYCTDKGRLAYLHTLQSMLPLIGARFTDRLPKLRDEHDAYKARFFEGGLPQITEEQYARDSQEATSKKEELTAEMQKLEASLRDLTVGSGVSIDSSSLHPESEPVIIDGCDDEVMGLALRMQNMSLENHVLQERIVELNEKVTEAKRANKTLCEALENTRAEFEKIKEEAAATLGQIEALTEDMKLPSEETGGKVSSAVDPRELEATEIHGPAGEEDVALTPAELVDLINSEGKVFEEPALKPEASNSEIRAQTAAASHAMEAIRATHLQLNLALTGVLKEHQAEKTAFFERLASDKADHEKATLEYQDLMRAINVVHLDRGEEEEEVSPVPFTLTWSEEDSVKDLRAKVSEVPNLRATLADLLERKEQVEAKLASDKAALKEQIAEVKSQIAEAASKAQEAQRGINAFAEEGIEGASKGDLMETPNLGGEIDEMAKHRELSSTVTTLSASLADIEHQVSVLVAKVAELAQKKSSS